MTIFRCDICTIDAHLAADACIDAAYSGDLLLRKQTLIGRTAQRVKPDVVSKRTSNPTFGGRTMARNGQHSGPTGFGIRIKQKRNELALTQTELAELVGVTGAAYSRWEREASLPSGRHLARLAEIFNVSVAWILSGDPPTTNGDNRDVLEALVAVTQRLHREIVLLRADLLRPSDDGVA